MRSGNTRATASAAVAPAASVHGAIHRDGRRSSRTCARTRGRKRADFARAVSFDPGEDDDHAQLLGKRVDRVPEVHSALTVDGHFLDAGLGGSVDDLFTHEAAAVAALAVDSHPPGGPDEPRAEALAVPQLPEAAIRLRQRVLRDVLGVFPVPEHAVRDPERQCAGIPEAFLELAREVSSALTKVPG